MGHDPELNLGVVGRNDDPVWRPGHKGLADFFAAFRADGDVLEVGVGTGQASCCRKCLIERGVHAAIGLTYIRRERLYVCGKELFDGPEFKDFVYYWMAVRYFLKGGFIRGILAPGALFGLRVQP